MKRKLLTALAGVGLVLHGLAHSVLPMRGAGGIETSALGRFLSSVGWTSALLLFVAAGLGLLGARPFRLGWRTLAFMGAGFSVLVLASHLDGDLSLGLLIDGAVIFLLVRPRATIRVPPRAGSVARRLARGIRDASAVAFALYLGVFSSLRSWHRNYGSTPDER